MGKTGHVTQEELCAVQDLVVGLRTDIAKGSFLGPPFERLQEALIKVEHRISEVHADAERQLEELSETTAVNCERQQSLSNRIGAVELCAQDIEEQVKDVRTDLANVQPLIQQLVAELRLEMRQTIAFAEVRAERHANDAIAAAASNSKVALDTVRRELQDGMAKSVEASEIWQRECEESVVRLGNLMGDKLHVETRARESAVTSAVNELRAELVSLEAQTKETLVSDFCQQRDSWMAADAARLSDVRDLRSSLDACCKRTCGLEVRATETEDALSALKLHMGTEIANLDGVVAQKLRVTDDHMAKLRAFGVEVCGMPVREVQWTLQDALCVVDDLKQKDVAFACEGQNAKYMSLWSPDFAVGGARGMRIQIRLLRPSEKSPREFKSAGEGELDCSVFIWAPAGLRLSFRVFVGGESAVVEHLFDGRSPCGVLRMCCLADQIRASGGELHAGIEIFDAARSWAAASTEDVSNAVFHEPSCGALSLRTCVNHRLLDLIRQQNKGLLELVQRKVDIVRSRAVRRVQWRLEGAQRLRQCFAEGRALCSTAFAAGGVSGLQMVFYPSGCATARTGFCSFFLSCPAGYVMKCWLWAGRWRKEARPEPADRLDLLGRVNFCRFESCVDPVDESVELAIEFEEVQRVTRDAPPGAEQQEGLENLEEGPPQLPTLSSMANCPAVGRIDVSTVRLQHGAGQGGGGRGTAEPDEGCVEQLPNIWTSHGFHTFGDLADTCAGDNTRVSSANMSCRVPRAECPSADLSDGVHTARPGTSPQSNEHGSKTGQASRSRQLPVRVVRTPRLFAGMATVPPGAGDGAGARKYHQYLKS